MSLILKIAGNEWNNASRDKRELSVYKELGHNVLVMAKGKEHDYGRVENVDGFKVLRYTTRPLGTKIPKGLNRLFAIIEWTYYARKINPDVISGHNLIPGLTIAWLSTLFKRKKPILIYDSHEFELGRNGVQRNKLTSWLIAKIEKYLMKQCAFSIMVNDSIADEVQRIYKLEERPVVLRSTPDYWEIDEKECIKKRQEFLDKFRKMKRGGVEYILMYHGAVMGGRGIERLIEAVANFQDIGLVILGNGGQQYIESLRELVKKRQVKGKVFFHPSVPIEELWKFVGAVDISLAPIELVAKNHYFSLPNKFFESIQAMTPIIASEVPEMKRIIDKYGIGLTSKPGNVDDICRCITKMRSDQDFYQQCKENLKVAKKELCWENEKKVLIEAFEKIIN